MDARRVLIFREVAERGSIAAAARALGWTQPAVSQHVRALERELRCALVLRRSSGVVLTEAGRALLVHADALAARLRSAESEIAALADVDAGVVRLAAFPSAAATIVPRALRALARAHPRLEVRLTEAEPPEAIARTRTGDADVGVVFAFPDDPGGATPPDLAATGIGSDPSVLLVPAGHPAATADAARGVADLRDEQWIAGCPGCREHLRRVCAEAGFVPDVVHGTDDYVVVQALVAECGAVALLPGLALRCLTRPDVAVLDRPALGSRELAVVHHPEAARVPAVRAVVAALVDQRV